MKYVKWAFLDLVFEAVAFVIGYGIFYVVSTNYNLPFELAFFIAAIITLGLWFGGSLLTSFMSNK